MPSDLAERPDPDTEFDGTVEGVMDALEPLGFEPNVVDWSGGEPCASLMLDDGRCLDVTVTLRMWCSCCDLDGTHHHERCDHPCCTEGDDEAVVSDPAVSRDETEHTRGRLGPD